MIRRTIFGTLALLLAFAFTTPMLMAQSLISGDITGTVTDPSGAVVPGATVTLKSIDTGAAQTTTTNSTGFYRFSLLQPGPYQVTVTQKGFQTTQRQVTVAVGQATAANMKLAVGQTTETVEVTGAVPLVNTDNSNASTSYSLREVANIPNPGGDLTNIAQLAPGVTMNTSMGYGNFTSDGMPGTSNLFTINGENDMDPFFNINNSGATNLTLGQNEIAEATVVTNPYSGQYGQLAGAQVTYVTKSGTNNFHGSAKWLWNGRSMNANDWFNKHTSPITPRPFANNNQWGVDFGGPIIKDKTFFYVDQEGLRYVLPTVQNTYVPSQQFIASSLNYLQANASPTAYNTYKQLYSLWGTPNVPGFAQASPVANSCGDIINPDGTSRLPGLDSNSACMVNFSSTPGQLSTEWILVGRLDQNIGQNDKAFVRYKMDRGVQATLTDPVNSNYNATSTQPSYDGQLQWTHIFSGNTTNQFIGAVSYYSAIFKQPNISNTGLPYGFYFYGDASPLTRFGYAAVFPQGRNVTQYQFVDDFSHVMGNHTFKFGGNFHRYDITDYDFFHINPRIYVNSMYGLATDNIYRFLEGVTNSTSVPLALYGLDMYAQDEWRVTPNLKLTLALRAAHNSNPVCQTNCFSQYVAPFQQLQHGDTVPYNQDIASGLHQAYQSVDKINWSPRIGFTWSPFDNDKTVLSGGFGIFYDSLPQGIMESAFEAMPFFSDFNVYNTSWADPTAPNGGHQIALASFNALQTGFAAGSSFNDLSAATGGVFSAPAFTNFAGTMHTPQYQRWNLMWQQELTNNMALKVNYSGWHGIYIPILNGTLNAYDPGYCGTVGAYCGGGFPLNAPLDPSYSTVDQYSTSAVGNYNGLTTTLTQRFHHGLSFQASYTWSHTLDEVSNGGAFVYGNDSQLGQLNPTCLRCNNYGNADYDIRHNFVANFVWETPFKFSNSLVNNTLGGWTFAGAFFARSGLPYTIMDYNSFYPNLGGPGAVPGQALGPGYNYGATGTCQNGDTQCFNPADFVDATSAAFDGGTVYSVFPTQRRNQYRGPGMFDINFTVEKNIRLTERVHLGLGANFYNVLNHANFANPNWALSSGDPTQGYILSTVSSPASPYGSFVGAAAAPRLIQTQVKLIF